MRDIFKLAISIVLPFLASAIGGIFTASSVSTWYVELAKPSFNPPSWVFGPVWTVLYLIIGISFYLVWKRKYDKIAFTIFGVQLVLNALWSVLFFGLKMPFLAFIEIVFLWLSIMLMIFYFYRISRISAYLLIPYVLWVTFAAILNFYIYILN